MARRIPPFAALRAFEAAARHNSLKRGADELSLSPSAISHQVRALEDHLGVSLFYRQNGRLYLTEAAQTLLADLKAAFDILEDAVTRVTRRPDKPNLTLNLFPALAGLWLMRRLPSFQSAHPEIDIRLMTSLEPLDFSAADLDLAIHYLKSEPKGVVADFLFEEEVFPVASPELVARRGPITRAEDLKHHTLIYCGTSRDEWSAWFRAAGLSDLRPGHRLEVDNRALAIEAAMDGLGIAIARTPLGSDAIAQGRLVQVHDFKYRSGLKYFLVCPPRIAESLSVRKFRNWLKALCGEERTLHTAQTEEKGRSAKKPGEAGKTRR